MVKKIMNALKKSGLQRTTVLVAVFLIMAAVLIHRLFVMQIIDGQEYADNFSMRTTKTRTIKSTRGNIYDRNGKILASNEPSYSVTLEDSGTYETTRERNLSLNSEMYQITALIKKNGDSLDTGFHIVLNADGEYEFDVENFSLSRFRADVYGHNKIDELTSEEENASPKKILSDLSERFGITNPDKPYTEEELETYGLPEKYTKKELLEMASLRYLLSTTSYQKYVPVTVATDVSEETVALIKEHQADLEGIDIAQDSVRVYDDSVYFSSILGYTGKISTDELEELSEANENYSTTSIVGKTGIEEVMETTLQGTDGSETLYVDNLGKVLQMDEESRQEPVQGSDVYLTIDKNLQEAAYKILEQRIAGIIVSNIQPIKEFEADENTDTSAIPIPIYDVYYALINNSIIDISHFSEEDASQTEASLYNRFTEKREEVFETLSHLLTSGDTTPYNELEEETQEYVSYLVNDMLMKDTEILNKEAIDKADETYQAWTNDETLSLREYLTYAVGKNWIDITKFTNETNYLNADDVYEALSAYIQEYLQTDSSFSKLLYKSMLMDDVISGEELCLVLYDQGVLSTDDEDYASFVSGELNSYDLMISKIYNLEITPAQLALDPCSGSVVITDPNSGEILACVTYPGYDNNKLANQMDVSYYRRLNNDLSEPFYNKATQQRTAPGSTFKLVTTVACMTENVIDDVSEIQCTGLFDKIDGSPLQCWYHDGHGLLNITGAVSNSCNVFFAEAAYRLGLDSNGSFSDSTAMQTIINYAKMFDFNKNSGIEISEADPQISDEMPIPSAIGQGTHNYTTSQLARYVTTLANSGTSYDISLLDKVTDSGGNTIEDYTPSVESKLEVADNIWDDIHTGMRGVIQETNKEVFSDLGVTLAGKTGTAQQAKNRASHGLFIGYAPYENPEIAIAVRIAYGYSSTNAGLVAKDILNYYFNLEDTSQIITGKANSESSSNEQTD